jgi:aminoglycoside phosphotransferase (APT) family kinase protein
MADQSPSQAGLRRAAALAGPDAAVSGMRALAGGTHARTWLIETVHPEREFVLREFPPGDEAAARETDVLTALGGLGGLAPQLLASDAGGTQDAVPWVIITRLPGEPDIAPARPAAAARQLGQALARIHATSPDRLSGFQNVLERPGASPAGLAGPAASVVAGNWGLLASQPATLTHYDFWSGNTVWREGALTGVVDWPGAALGPPGFDTGWCRLDLYLLHGEHVADQFLYAYQAASGHTLPQPRLHDLWAAARSYRHVETWVPNYRDLGRTDLTAQELRARHTAWTQHLLASP